MGESEDAPAPGVLRNRRVLLHGRELSKPAQRLRRFRHEVAPQWQDLICPLLGIGRGAEHELRLNRVQRKLERHDNSEIAATAAQRPQEIGILRLARANEPTVGGDDIRGQQVVGSKSMAPTQPADSA